MYRRGRRFRFTAVSAMVVLALTGFSSGRGDGSGTDHSGGGGGCSSSSQDHDSSSSGSSGSDADDSGTSTGDSGGGKHRPTYRSTRTPSPSSETARPLKDGTAVLISCASPDDPYATVEVRNPNARDGLFTVKVSFKDSHGFTMIETGNQVSVPAKDTATYRVAVAGSGRVDEIDRCEVSPRATVDR